MIYIVEDDQSIRNMEIYTLVKSGFEAVGFGDGKEFFRAMSEQKPEIILLDIMLPYMDGVEILKKIRADADTRRIPVIMVTAKGQEYDKVLSLDLGADDYLVKPFGMMEMVSRIKAVLRRVSPTEVQHILKVGSLEVNTDERTAFVEKERIQLTYKEYELLLLFLKNPGRAFTRDQIFSSVWGDEYVGESRTVDVHIQTLRNKLGSCAEMIETVRNVGYRLEAGKK